MIILPKIFGPSSKYRVSKDPAFEFETHKPSKAWLYRVECKRGHLFAVSTTRVGYTAAGATLRKRLEEIPGVGVSQCGDEEFTVCFDESLIDVVAQVVKPKMKRVLSPEQRARLVEAGKAYRIPGANRTETAQIEENEP